MPFLTEYWSVLSDPAHIAAEATWEAGTAILLAAPFRYFVKRHDRKRHPHND